ncbi:unnamed protein product [Mytilus edulis]|uniref:DZIP3-like HEPN domain-containing protein n=1 Tax=Mytilus edulis TaxID=6550 RepID=A0A8S3U245_MYTED|nr:unnamed protein product [Mytilus edulis]
MSESEEMNYLRIISLLYKVAPSAVRVKFDKEFHPENGLEPGLKQDKFKVLEPLRKRESLTRPSGIYCFHRQVKLNFRVNDQYGDNMRRLTEIYWRFSGTVTSKKFDLTLMICLIRHLTPIQIVDILPLKADVSEGADLSRLKYYRNMFAHQDAWTLTNNDFETYWNDICQAILKLGGPQFKQICEDLKDKVLNNNDKEILVELRNSQKESSQVPKALQKIHEDLIYEWGNDNNKVVKTRAIYRIEELLKSEDVIVAVGSSGCGKSTAIHHVAYQLHKQEGVELLSEKACDFVSDYSLTEIERNQIARIYLTECEIYAIKKSGLVGKFSFFPLLCCLYSKQKLTGVLNFFDNPISVIRSDLNLLRKATDQTTLATMSLFIAFNNSLDENVLSRSHGMTELLEVISDHFHLQAFFSIKVVKAELQKLEMTYVMKTVTTYKIFHDKIYDIFLSFCGEYFLELVLEVAHKDVIRDRFVLDSVQNENQNIKREQNSIQVTDIEEQHYFARILKDIQNGFIKDVFLNRQIKCMTFRTKLFQYLEKEIDLNEILLNVPSEIVSDMLLSMTRQCYWDMVPIVLTEHVDVNIIKQISPSKFDGETPLFLAVETNRIDIVKFQLDNKYDLNLCNDKAETPLFKASTTCQSDVVKLSLENNCDFNICNAQNESLLFISSMCGHADIVALLLKHNCDPNICNDNNISPVFAACHNGHTDVVKLLLENKCDPNICNDSNESLVFIASSKGRYDTESPLFIASTWNISRVLPRYCRFFGCVNPYSSFYLIVKLLLEHNCDLNTCNAKHESALFGASMYGHTDIVMLLLEHHCDPNICNEENESPLFIASRLGHTDIVRKLLEYDCDPNICNDRNESPLFIALKMCHANVVKLLLDKNSNISPVNNSDAS